MIRYRPGDSLAHRLDPRSKLAVQAGFGVAAFAHSTPAGLAAVTLLTLGVLAASGTSPATLAAYRSFLPFLVAAPVVSAVRLGPPWLVPAAATEPAVAVYRMLLLLLVSAAYVRTTPVRESRAAVQSLLPGRAGALVGVGIGLVFRMLPVLRDDLRRIRQAMHARLAAERPLHDRARLVGVTGLRRAFARSDALALALQARCFAWNPTLPALAFERTDWLALGFAAALCLSALV